MISNVATRRSDAIAAMVDAVADSGIALPGVRGEAATVDARRARELVGHMRRDGQLPPYFQVVLKVSFKQGIPVESSYVFTMC